MTLKVYKFGGTSVGSPEAMRRVLGILTRDEYPKLTVLSAKAGTTDKLKKLSDLLDRSEPDRARDLLAALRTEYEEMTIGLFHDESFRRRARPAIEPFFQTLKTAMALPAGPRREKIILAQGELMSTTLFHLLCQECGVRAVLLPALDIVRVDNYGEPDLEAITPRIAACLRDHPRNTLFITQGYIARNHAGEIDNLGRGGSDLTATLLGAAVNAAEIQIWSDIDGVHNNDPRVVRATFPVRRLSYREASCLAYFGAKVLHPMCVIPAERRKIPLLLKNTFAPEAEGTLISECGSDAPLVTAVSARDNMAGITVHALRDRPACEFLGGVFDLFRHYKIPVDMVTVSESSVALAVADTPNLPLLLAELALLGHVEWEKDLCIVNAVGSFPQGADALLATLSQEIEGIPLRMIAHAAGQPNVLLLIGSEHKRLMLSIFQEIMYRTTPHRAMAERTVGLTEY